jgi:hypothetical protein
VVHVFLGSTDRPLQMEDATFIIALRRTYCKFHTGGTDENQRSSAWDDGRLRLFSMIVDF